MTELRTNEWLTKFFEKQIGRNVEVYVDDIVIKTSAGRSHLEELREIFDTLSKYTLKMNPSKCSLSCTQESFLAS